MATGYYHSPVGVLEIRCSDNGLEYIQYLDQEKTEADEDTALLSECRQQLDQYFAGTLEEFTIPLSPQGSEFQLRVWKELLTIPYGETVSYLDIAQKLGDANATRAVGSANGRNNISIVIPCHRVIGSNGKLTGYAGGLERKKWLLAFERKRASNDLFSGID